MGTGARPATLEGVGVFVPRDATAYLNAMYNGGASGGVSGSGDGTGNGAEEWRSKCVASSWNHEFEFEILTNRHTSTACRAAMACAKRTPPLPIVNINK